MNNRTVLNSKKEEHVSSNEKINLSCVCPDSLLEISGTIRTSFVK